jgi:hypothetical protein
VLLYIAMPAIWLMAGHLAHGVRHPALRGAGERRVGPGRLGLLPLRRRRFVRVMTGRGLVSRDGRGYRYLHPVFRDYGRGRRGGGAEER